MVLVPIPPALATPALLMMAIAVFEELQLTAPVRFWVLPLLYVPVAANCCVVPLVIEGLAGVTAIDNNVGAVPGSGRKAIIPVMKSPNVAAVAVNVAATEPDKV